MMAVTASSDSGSTRPPSFQRRPEATPAFRLTRQCHHFRLVKRVRLARYLRRWVGHAEVPCLVLAITRPPMLNGLLGHVCRPTHTTSLDPVVRAACEIPVSDRWAQRNGVAIELKRPVGRRDRRHHLLAATAGAPMDRRGVLHRHVQNSILQLAGHQLHELVRKLVMLQVGFSSLVSRLKFVE